MNTTHHADTTPTPAPQPATAAARSERPVRGPTDVELSDEELERVVGGGFTMFGIYY